MKLPPVETISLPYDLASRPIPAHLPPEQRSALRKLPFHRAHNFRDLGGYLARDGRSLKWGKLYRADKLSRLTEDDCHYLERLGIRKIIDFRSDDERYESPHSLMEGSEIQIQALPIAVDAAQVEKISRQLQRENVAPAEMGLFLEEANREMVERFTDTFREWMQVLLDERDYPLVFHCTAGKDRTGLAAALVMSALDIPFETIMEDYLATNHFTNERIERNVKFFAEQSMYQVNGDVVRTLFGVEPRYLNAAFTTIEEKYQSVDRYLEIGLGIGQRERRHLQQLLLSTGDD